MRAGTTADARPVISIRKILGTMNHKIFPSVICLILFISISQLPIVESLDESAPSGFAYLFNEDFEDGNLDNWTVVNTYVTGHPPAADIEVTTEKSWEGTHSLYYNTSSVYQDDNYVLKNIPKSDVVAFEKNLSFYVNIHYFENGYGDNSSSRMKRKAILNLYEGTHDIIDPCLHIGLTDTNRLWALTRDYNDISTTSNVTLAFSFDVWHRIEIRTNPIEGTRIFLDNTTELTFASTQWVNGFNQFSFGGTNNAIYYDFYIDNVEFYYLPYENEWQDKTDYEALPDLLEQEYTRHLNLMDTDTTYSLRYNYYDDSNSSYGYIDALNWYRAYLLTGDNTYLNLALDGIDDVISFKTDAGFIPPIVLASNSPVTNTGIDNFEELGNIILIARDYPTYVPLAENISEAIWTKQINDTNNLVADDIYADGTNPDANSLLMSNSYVIILFCQMYYLTSNSTWLNRSLLIYDSVNSTKDGTTKLYPRQVVRATTLPVGGLEYMKEGDDVGNWLEALCQLYEATTNSTILSTINEFVNSIITYFWDDTYDCFYYEVNTDGSLLSNGHENVFPLLDLAMEHAYELSDNGTHLQYGHNDFQKMFSEHYDRLNGLISHAVKNDGGFNNWDCFIDASNDVFMASSQLASSTNNTTMLDDIHWYFKHLIKTHDGFLGLKRAVYVHNLSIPIVSSYASMASINSIMQMSEYYTTSLFRRDNVTVYWNGESNKYCSYRKTLSAFGARMNETNHYVGINNISVDGFGILDPDDYFWRVSFHSKSNGDIHLGVIDENTQLYDVTDGSPVTSTTIGNFISTTIVNDHDYILHNLTSTMNVGTIDGRTVPFTGSENYGVGISWSWDFGDGGSSSSQNPFHTYSSYGTFSVTLTVTDEYGATNSTTRNVVVSGRPPLITEDTKYAIVDILVWGFALALILAVMSFVFMALNGKR